MRRSISDGDNKAIAFWGAIDILWTIVPVTLLHTD
jgi:hypothetical protein